MKRFALLAVSVALAGSMATADLAAQAPRRPFPRHTAYAAGSILPGHRSRPQLDAAALAFYRQWRARYLVAGCGPGRYYVSVNADGKFPDPEVLSISEGHGYGMLLTAYFAGADPDAKTAFDGLYRYFRDHPSDRYPNVMAWKQLADCADAPDGQDTATDGDLDIGYALLLADRQWGSAGAINYLAEARKVIRAIRAVELHPVDATIQLGSWVSTDQPRHFNSTRTSDFMPGHFKAFRLATGDARWATAANRVYVLVKRMQTVYSPATGLLPDFIERTNAVARPASPGFLEGPADGAYFYNACRTPWRLGLDALLSGDVRGRTAVRKISTFLRTAAAGDPERLRAGFRLDGRNLPGNDYTDLSFLAPATVGALLDPEHPEWVEGLWDEIVSAPIQEADYYGNTLKALALLAASGNAWQP
ncbi:MAG TPA: glycosyl hydrolase family 8 [Thermoanaerobaculia bacterium]|jgi:endo-1,4-beta-D-glucanase Y|nr:glycosyl hydrolase family 8 [Thermoanaerobaculia bacterium]